MLKLYSVMKALEPL